MPHALLIIIIGAVCSAAVWWWRLPDVSTQIATTLIARGSVTPATFASYLQNQNPILIDIRTPAEFADAHLPGAQNIDFYAADFVRTISNLDRSTAYAIYCRSGNRTQETLRLMRELGFTYVYDLSGGILAWEAAGHRTCNSFTC